MSRVRSNGRLAAVINASACGVVLTDSEERWRHRHDPWTFFMTVCAGCDWSQADKASIRYPERMRIVEALLDASAWYHRCNEPDVALVCFISRAATGGYDQPRGYLKRLPGGDWDELPPFGNAVLSALFGTA